MDMDGIEVEWSWLIWSMGIDIDILNSIPEEATVSYYLMAGSDVMVAEAPR